MSKENRQLVVLAATVLAAFAVLASTAMLVADAAVARRQAPLDAQRVEVLEERLRTEAEAAAELEAERKRQTETSLARQVTNRRLGWVLLVAAAAFLTGAKQLLPDRRQPVSLRAPPGANAGSHRFQPVAEALVEPAQPDIDLTAVDDFVARHGRGREAAIPILQAIQAHYRYLPEAALRRLTELSEITPAQIAGTASFYARFRRTPVGDHLVRVCHGTACHVAGARHVDEELRRRLAIPPGADTDPRRRFTLEPVACIGCCSLAPVIMVGAETAGRLTPATAGDRLAALAERA